MTLLGSTKNETTKDKNCGNLPSLQNDEVVLIHWNIVLTVIISMIQESCIICSK